MSQAIDLPCCCPNSPHRTLTAEEISSPNNIMSPPHFLSPLLLLLLLVTSSALLLAHASPHQPQNPHATTNSRLTVSYQDPSEIAPYLQAKIETHLHMVEGDLLQNYEIVVHAVGKSHHQMLLHNSHHQSTSTANRNATQFSIKYSPEQHQIHLYSQDRFSQLAAIYHTMRKFGVLFLHPLQVVYHKRQQPRNLLPQETVQGKYTWIGSHVHTMHPLELTDLLNGFVSHSKQVGTREEYLAFMHRLWDPALEWMLATKTNMIEWILLRVHEVQSGDTHYDKSQERLERLALLVDRAHDHGIFVGIDVPIALQQQHSWALIESFGNKDKENQQIEQNTKWLAQAKFDYITTELGFSEFTHGNATRMLEWLDYLTEFCDSISMRTFTKAHISTGQTVPGWIDPVTKKDGMNFNFLPYYAVKDLGIMPHTVQFYSFDDPANTYGNQNFTHMLKYLEVELGRREVLYFPETAYWVNYDINVPLFLPLYIDRRLKDLRTIVEHERSSGKKMDGHIIFSSGWEFGYWLSDTLVNEMAFNGSVVNLDRSHDEDLKDLLMTVFIEFGEGDLPQKLTNAVYNLIVLQRKYLIFGGKGSNPPPKSAGQSYLEGWDTWSDVMTLVTQYFGKNVATQPDGLRITQVRHGLDRVLDGPKYREDIAPLLKEMREAFSSSAKEFTALRDGVNKPLLSLFDDLSESTQLLALRAAQVHETFEYASAAYEGATEEDLAQRRTILSQIMIHAHSVMDQRVAQFHAPNLGSWNQNPTAYPFYYLYQARTLFFWWRDIGQAVFDKFSPCYMNTINPVDVSLGEGFLSEFTTMIREFLDKMKKAEWIADCLAAPTHEPKVPPFDF